jgi:hypothetical protein
MMKLDIVFVCQQGEIEVMAALLAASLRKFCGHHVMLHVIEPVPVEVYGSISPLTRQFLTGLDVSWYQFPNPISDAYKIFNKLNAFHIRPQGDKILFLDSDIFVRRPLQPLLPYCNHMFAARAAFAQRFTVSAKRWGQVYRLFDVPVPAIRWPSTGTYEWGPPYFNAGVVLADPSLDFSTVWIETHRRIHDDHSIRMKDRGTVQVSLPVALYRRQTPYALLDRRLHFLVNQRRLEQRTAWVDDEAHVVHYFHAKNLCRDSIIHREVHDVIDEFGLHEILTLSERWQAFRQADTPCATRVSLSSGFRGQSSLRRLEPLHDTVAGVRDGVRPGQGSKNITRSGHFAFIAGIPGSGMREFASMLALWPNVVGMHGSHMPPGRDDFDGLRDSLAHCWHTIERWRMANGTLPHEEVTRLLGHDVAARLRQTLHGDDFVVCLQHSRPLLPRLQALAEAFPEASIFVLVRNPFETIQCWKRSPHLLSVPSAADDSWAGLNPAHLDEEQRNHWLSLRALGDIALQRAGLWDCLAALADTHADNIHILRYEDMQQHPQGMMRYVYATLFPTTDVDLPDLSLPPARPSAARGGLSAWEIACIQAICTRTAGIFDYNLYDIPDTVEEL